MATTTPDRVTVQPAGAATCDVCQGRVDTSSTVTFADDTYSRRCSTHDDAKFDRAGSRRPLPATPAITIHHKAVSNGWIVVERTTHGARFCTRGDISTLYVAYDRHGNVTLAKLTRPGGLPVVHSSDVAQVVAWIA